MKLTYLKNRLLKKNIIIASAIVLIIFLSEALFDIAEITIGTILELTNPFRPRSGTIWELEKQDKIAIENLSKITENINANNDAFKIDTITKLKNLLKEKETLIISADNFLQLYNMLPHTSAQEIISPFAILKIFNSKQWMWTKIIKRESGLSFIFLAGDNQIIMDSYPDLTVLYQINMIESTPQKSLSSIAAFIKRTLTPEQFFNAFNNLPNPIKLQLINNPFQLIEWLKNIRFVAVSRYVEQNTVLIGFEIFNGIDNDIYTFQASELAANYLINQLNFLYPDLKLTMPGF